MIPDYLIECAARAVHEKHGQHIAPRYMDTPTWYRNDLEAQTATALEAAAPDFWDHGYVDGVEAARHHIYEDNTAPDTPNPYKASEGQ